MLSRIHDRSRKLQIEERKAGKAAEKAADMSASKALAQLFVAQQVQEVSKIFLLSEISKVVKQHVTIDHLLR